MIEELTVAFDALHHPQRFAYSKSSRHLRLVVSVTPNRQKK